jgi:hypothetical protein
MRLWVILLAVFLIGASAPFAAETVLLEFGSPMVHLANSADPGIGSRWTSESFDDASWPPGQYGVGYEAGSGAAALLRTVVPAGTSSVYTRTTFTIDDASQVTGLFLGVDYDDGFVAWINGAEVYRSAEMPASGPLWNTRAALHESSNAPSPNYAPLRDISAAGIPALHQGDNLLAIGVWNSTLPSSDLVLVPRLSINRGASLTRGPYLQAGTPESIVVRWRTDVSTPSRVLFGPEPGSLVSSVTDPVRTTEHVVTLTGLFAGTRYHYAIGTSTEILAGDDADHFFVTSPAPGAGKPTRVWVVGDSGTADSNARAVRDAYRTFAGDRLTDLWLMLGDNAYPDGTDGQYQAAVFDTYPDLLAKSVLWPTLGNHDGHTADSATQSGPYYDIFTLPAAGEAGGMPSGTEAYYSFDYGDIHFICLESHETDRSAGGAMMTWLREDALATNKDWIIAFWHHPPYSKGSHDSDSEGQLIEMRQNALPILEEAGVDLVLTGHSHSYERTFLLDGHYGQSSTLTEGMIKDHGDGREEGSGAYQKPSSGPSPHEGAVYVVAGSSGQAGGGPLNHPAMYVSLSTLGSLVLDLNGNRLDATFLDAANRTRDHFTIMKGPANQPPQAVARSESQVECDAPEETTVRLDGSASTDADSSPGTNDDIVSFEWFEDYGTESQALLGTGEQLTVGLPLGAHALTLRVTDSMGDSDTDEIIVTISDTVPPSLSVSLTPTALWPPNHLMAPVQATIQASDACGSVTVSLLSITSSEADNAQGVGDGHTTHDISGADFGAPDTQFDLRAERAATGPGRTYTVTYEATDGSGHTVRVMSHVIVPHSNPPGPRAAAR